MKRVLRDSVPRKMIFLHGLESGGQAYKANVMRQVYPELITPDFKGLLHERMEQLYSILGDIADWIIVGSSLGGLMGAIFTCEHPEQVQKLVLLAPALILPQFAPFLEREPVTVPTIIIHGTQDNVIPLGKVREIAEKVFADLTYHIVDDDHCLHAAATTLDWKEILA